MNYTLISCYNYTVITKIVCITIIIINFILKPTDIIYADLQEASVRPRQRVDEGMQFAYTDPKTIGIKPVIPPKKRNNQTAADGNSNKETTEFNREGNGESVL